MNTLGLSGPSTYPLSSQAPSLSFISPCQLRISRRRSRKVSQFWAVLPRRQAPLALQKSDGDEFVVQELADGSLLFSFGPNDNGTNEVQRFQLPPRLPSRFQKRNPIPKKKIDISSQQSQDGEEVLPSLDKVETAVTQNSIQEGDSSSTFSSPPRLPSRFLKSSPIPFEARKQLRPPPTPTIVSVTSSHVTPPTADPSASLTPISHLTLDEPPHSEVFLDSSFSPPLSSNHIHLPQSSGRGSISSPVASFVSNNHVSSSNGAAFSLQSAVSSISHSGIKTSPVTRPTTRRNASPTKGSFSTFSEIGRSGGDVSTPSRPPSAFVKRSPISDRSPNRDTPSKANSTSTSAVSESVSHTETRSQNRKKETSGSSSPNKRASKKLVKASGEGVNDDKVEVKSQTASRPPCSFVRQSPIPALTPLRSPPVALTSSKEDVKSTTDNEVQPATSEVSDKSSKKSSKSSKTTRKTRAGASKASVKAPSETPIAKEDLVSSVGSAIEEIPPSTSGEEDTDDDKPEDKGAETQKAKVVKRRSRKPKVEVAAKTVETPVEEQTSRLKERAVLNGVALSEEIESADSPMVVAAKVEMTTKHDEGFNPPEITPTDTSENIEEIESKKSQVKEKSKRAKKKRSPVESAKDSVTISEQLEVDSNADEVTEETVQGKDYKSLTLPSLRELAKDKGLKGFSKLKKAELVDALVKSEMS